MPTSSKRPLFLGMVAGLLLACGSNAGLPGVNPSVAIRSPDKNSSVNLPANMQIAVGFDTNYTLRAAGTCDGLGNCGHVYLLVDSSNCNAPNRPYNNLAVSSPSFVDLSRCATPTGMHTITVELRHDDSTVVQNLVGNPVSDDVTFTVQ